MGKQQYTIVNSDGRPIEPSQLNGPLVILISNNTAPYNARAFNGIAQLLYGYHKQGLDVRFLLTGYLSRFNARAEGFAASEEEAIQYGEQQDRYWYNRNALGLDNFSQSLRSEVGRLKYEYSKSGRSLATSLLPTNPPKQIAYRQDGPHDFFGTADQNPFADPSVFMSWREMLSDESFGFKERHDALKKAYKQGDEKKSTSKKKNATKQSLRANFRHTIDEATNSRLERIKRRAEKEGRLTSLPKDKEIKKHIKGFILHELAFMTCLDLFAYVDAPVDKIQETTREAFEYAHKLVRSQTKRLTIIVPGVNDKLCRRDSNGSSTSTHGTSDNDEIGDIDSFDGKADGTSSGDFSSRDTSDATQTASDSSTSTRDNSRSITPPTPPRSRDHSVSPKKPKPKPRHRAAKSSRRLNYDLESPIQPASADPQTLLGSSPPRTDNTVDSNADIIGLLLKQGELNGVTPGYLGEVITSVSGGRLAARQKAPQQGGLFHQRAGSEGGGTSPVAGRNQMQPNN